MRVWSSLFDFGINLYTILEGLMEIVKLVNGNAKIFFAIRLEETVLDRITFFGTRIYKKQWSYLAEHSDYTFKEDNHVLQCCAFLSLESAERRLKHYFEQKNANKIVKVIERKCKCK